MTALLTMALAIPALCCLGQAVRTADPWNRQLCLLVFGQLTLAALAIFNTGAV